MPLTMHIFTGSSLDGGMPEHWGTPGGTIKGYTMAQTTVINTMIDLICGGVCERFPGLKFVISRVRDRLGGAVPAAPRPRRLPHAERSPSTTSR